MRALSRVSALGFLPPGGCRASMLQKHILKADRYGRCRFSRQQYFIRFVARGALLKVLGTSWLAVLSLMIAGLMNTPEMKSQSAGSLPLMPMPAHFTQGEGQFIINGSFAVELQGYKDARVVSARLRFLNVLFRETGIPFYDAAMSDQGNFIIKTAGASNAVQSLGEDESYRLEISTNHVE